ncbi:hypothetical protein SI65_01055 [Aspergillus cristatus]|uniref:Haloacid dehalogenase, type II n=1 Tax=Aspergillus cristatus TaxID=573508 RepID=A0A1E3BSW9_ASPCR|nr:hypothetical protein SI65_01055 [Aspergillus cristatus]
MTKKVVIAMDIYGTVLTMETIAQELEKHFPKANAEAILKTWRQHQLAYTWRLNSLGRFLPFSEVTRNALSHTLAETPGADPAEQHINRLMAAFENMGTFPDVGPTLSRLAVTPGVVPVVFTNGTKTMVSHSLSKSKDLAPYSAVFQDIVTVEEVKQFKPAPAVYNHLAETVGLGSQKEDIWVISANPFDINGARNAGLKAIWIDRSLTGWTDRAEPSLEPTAVLHSLEDIIQTITHHYKDELNRHATG